MSFKPSDANILVESIFADLVKALKKRKLKTPDETLEIIQEQVDLALLILTKVSKPTNKRKAKDGKIKSKKKSKTDGKDEASPPEVKDLQAIALA